MDKINLNAVAPAVAKVEMERGEEPLYEIVPVNQGTEHITVIAGLDAGSTQTRVNLITLESQDINNPIIIPSAVQKVPDNRELKPKSEVFYDRMDTNLVNISMNTDAVFNNVRLIRGRKTTDNNFPELRLQSTIKKTDEEVFYYNIIDALGYATMLKFKDAVPKEIDVYAGIALPPDDMATSKMINKFLNKILGSYKWMHKDSGISIMINIKDVEVCTEPEAFAQAYYISLQEEMPEKVIMVNTGGRSTGLELLDNGKSVTEISKTLPVGGRPLLLALNKKIIQSDENTIEDDISEEQLLRAIKRGYVKQGRRGRVDVVKEIKSVLRDYATDFMSAIKTNILDRQQLKITDVEEIIISGGLVRRGDYDISLADFLGEDIEKLSPDTDFTVVEDNYIPMGTALLAYQTFSNELLADDEDDEEEFDDLELDTDEE